MIYFAQVGGAVKIGCSHRSIEARINSLKAATHEPITLLASCPGSFDLEKEYHARFDDERIAKEWFRPSPRLLAACKEIGIASDDADDGNSTRVAYSKSVGVSVTLHRDAYAKIEKYAKNNTRSVRGEIQALINDGLAYRALPKRELQRIYEGRSKAPSRPKPTHSGER